MEILGIIIKFVLIDHITIIAPVMGVFFFGVMLRALYTAWR